MSVLARASIRAGVTVLVVCVLALALLSNRSAQSGAGTGEPRSSIEAVELAGRECAAMPSPDAGWYGTSCDPSTSRRESGGGWSTQ